MHEFGFQVVAQIVVPKELICLQIKGQLVLVSFDDRLLILVKADAYFTRHDEVHLQYLFLLIVYDTFFLVIRKVSGFQAEGYIMKELAVLVFLRVEEEPEVVEDVIEEVVDQDAAFYGAGEGLYELIVFFYFTQAIMRPVVFKVRVDLAVKRVRKRTVLPKPSQQSHPVMKFVSLRLHTRLINRLHDLDKTSHNEGEVGDPSEHEYDDQTHFKLALRA